MTIRPEEHWLPIFRTNLMSVYCVRFQIIWGNWLTLTPPPCPLKYLNWRIVSSNESYNGDIKPTRTSITDLSSCWLMGLRYGKPIPRTWSPHNHNHCKSAISLLRAVYRSTFRGSGITPPPPPPPPLTHTHTSTPFWNGVILRNCLN